MCHPNLISYSSNLIHFLQENLRITSVQLPVHLRYHRPSAPQDGGSSGILGVGGLAGELLPTSFSGISGAQSQGGAQPQMAYSASSPGIFFIGKYFNSFAQISI